MIHTVGLGEFKVSRASKDVIVTRALGSCVAIAASVPILDLGILMHVQLPNSEKVVKRDICQPARYADTAIKLLVKILRRYGCKNLSGVNVKLAGGANIADPNQVFQIGKQNILAIKKWLWQHDMAVTAEDVGGTTIRNVELVIGKSKVKISEGKRLWFL